MDIQKSVFALKRFCAKAYLFISQTGNKYLGGCVTINDKRICKFELKASRFRLMWVLR